MNGNDVGFGARLGMALRLLFNGEFAREVVAGFAALKIKTEKPAPLPPERVHASSLLLLAGLQREGRFVDFLQQEVAGFSDDEVGAAARVVHAGCGKVLKQYFGLEPAVPQAEGAAMTIPQGFDAQRVRLTGNVTGQAPYKGTLKHHGWVAKAVRMPEVSAALDPTIVAPAEVEI